MKFQFFVFVLLFCLLLLFTTYSYAYTWNDFVEFTTQNTTNSNVPGNIKTASQKFISNLSLIESRISSSGINLQNYSYFYATYSSSYPGSIDMFVFNGNGAFTYTSSQMQLTNMTGYAFRIYNLNSNGYTIQNKEILNNSTKINNKSDRFNSTWGLIYDSNNYGNYWFNGKYVPPYTGPVFTPSNNGVISVYNSLGVSEIFTRLPYYPLGDKFVTLGYVTDFEDVYQITGYFGPYIQSNNDGNNIDSKYSFLYNYYYGTKNGNLYFDSSTGRVYVNRDILLNKQGYNLFLNYQLSIADNDAADFYEGGFYSYDGNLNIPSGDLISNELPNYNDINAFINSFGNFWEYNSGDKENTDYNVNELLGVGDLFSGDFFSGDIFNKIGYKTYHTRNQYSLTLYDFYRRIIGVLLDNSTTSYIEFDYRGNTYRFYSNDFKTPDSAFKTFISGFIIVLFSIGIVKRLSVLFKRMAVLDYVGISKSFDVDDSNFL